MIFSLEQEILQLVTVTVNYNIKYFYQYLIKRLFAANEEQKMRIFLIQKCIVARNWNFLLLWL